jgi:hypothetical protein
MKVIDLIQRLQEFDPEMPVVLSGYEGGFNTVTAVVEPRTFAEGVNESWKWYYGPHELDNEYLEEEHAGKPRFEAVTIY